MSTPKSSPTFPSTGPRPCIVVPDVDQHPAYPLEVFSVPEHYRDDLESVLIPSGLIQARVEKLAEDIFNDYGSTMIHVVCCLKGGAQFFSDIVTFLKRGYSRQPGSVPFTFDFIRVSSYKGMESSGEVKVHATGMDFAELKGKHVLLVEDMVDTGRTMAALVPELWRHNPATVRVCCLLQKRVPQSVDFVVDYLGFSVPNHFCIGYCLDYDEYFRDMDHICIINKACLPKYDALSKLHK